MPVSVMMNPVATHTKAPDVPFARRQNGKDLATQAVQKIVTQILREADPFLIDFVTAFWAPDSRHVRARAIVDQRPLSMDYLSHNRCSIQLYLSPFPGFKALRLSKLKAGIVKDWQL
jgi:hypothetical protein